jgi:hypothetical protein
MVLVAYKNGEIISAQEALKGKYDCIACKGELIYVSPSHTKSTGLERMSHFRHNTDCSYSNIFKEKDYYSEFNQKWTMELVNANNLYKYWGNKNIADIINNEGTIIVVKNNLIKNTEYVNKEIVWILNQEKRLGEIKKIMYDDGEERYFYQTKGKRYDLNMIPKKHKIYLDGGLNELIEITKISMDRIECKIVKVENFLEKNFQDITKTELIYENKGYEIETINGYQLIEKKVEELNEKLDKEIIEIKKKKLNFIVNLKEYIENYDKVDNDNHIIKTEHESKSDHADHNYFYEKYNVLKDDKKYEENFFEKIVELYTKNKNEKINVEMYYNARKKCKICLNELRDKEKNILTKENIEEIIKNYCKIQDDKEDRKINNRKISFSKILDYYKKIENEENYKKILENIEKIKNKETEKKEYKCEHYNDICRVELKKMEIKEKKCKLCNLELYDTIKDYYDNKKELECHDDCEKIFRRIKCEKCDNILEEYKDIEFSKVDNKNIERKSCLKCIFEEEYLERKMREENYKEIIKKDCLDLIKNNIQNKCNINCAMCNKNKLKLDVKYDIKYYENYFRKINILNTNRSFDRIESMEEVLGVKILDYMCICHSCTNTINKNNFYKQFIEDIFEKDYYLSEKQITILKKIKTQCNNRNEV